ncbi:type VI secretion system contractile sheath domain-containing protein [Scleromatobacter humisilvae]|uniref:Type VI secretion system contractile sheath large subunit n=1 Tax=Scleromatobacter humisilvae TaxID=2897159 RepID=A0A9X1YQU9_9BURK|nr:type VI secretion system contractile sheath large subunit [Scleromatobacter humisilvae]MCK9689728.1 type VI secretion system contractile sheath large subunit [Scleromatobacter humisilvae]
MPAIELNIGHLPSPRRQRSDDDGDDAAPFRVVVLGDLSGRPRARRQPLAERRPVRIDIDNFDSVFARIAPVAEIDGLQDEAGVALRIALESMDDFSADAVLARLPARASASASPPPAPAREDGAEDAAAMMKRLLGGDLPAGAPALAATPSSTADGAIDRFIRQLVGDQLVAATPAPATRVDEPAVSALLRHVLRDPAWRRLEGAWRAVDRFVRELDMADGQVRLELFDCRADELLADLGAVAAEPARAALAAVLNGDGRGCDVVVSLEEFGPSLVELSLLGGLASVAAAQGAVLLAGAAPALAAVATSDDAQVLAANESRVWRALRESALARHVGLTFPRLLARLPYGPRNEPVSAFPFDELADASTLSLHDALVWRSAALDAALLLAQGDVDGGVETRVQLADLPAFIDRSGEEPRLQAVAEAYLGERDVDVLQAAGLITLQSERRVPEARVSGWQSIAAGGGELAGSWR